MSSLKLSYEFFPPRNDAQQRRFWHTLGCLQTLNPSYISMTWGALGSNSQASVDVLTHLMKLGDIPVTAHLTCAGQTESQMRKTIAQLGAMGITDFLALRGDAGADATLPVDGEPTLQHASDLVSLLAEGTGRDISVAAYPEAHPESRSVDTDLTWLAHKVNAGATKAITQFFFDPATFLRFRDNAVAKGVSATLVPGILPIHDIQKVQDFSNKCGATVPAALVEHFNKATTVKDRRDAAVEQCVKLCNTLAGEGVDEFHLYTLNQSTLSYAVGCELSGIRPAAVAAA